LSGSYHSNRLHRHGHDNLHVRGYKEEGTTTTPFDMLVRNDMDRYHLAIDLIDRVPGLARKAATLRQDLHDKLTEHCEYIRRTGEDLAEIAAWTWSG
jgi:xylulose-5-phosphate/fructose-6-phosphate phosphoketolase